MEPWWASRPRIAGFVADLLRAEIVRARHGDEALPPLPWPETLRIDGDLGADSLERLGLAAALAEAIQLHRSGIEDALLVRGGLAHWVDVATAGLARHDAALTFRTSGSTGEPRSCSHLLADLEQEAAALAVRIGPVRRIVRAVPCHHIYGFLFTVLLPRHFGIAEGDVIDARASSASAIAHRLRAGDLVVAHPEFWRAFVRSGARAPEGVAGTTSTAPCPDALASEARAAGIAPLLQVYGSSETAGLAWRDAPGRAFALMPFWRRDGGVLVRSAADGTERRVTAPDRLSWVGERDFHVLERIDGAVQVGGINVFPAQVRAVLLQHPEVRDAAVRLMRPDEGSRLKAFIVPRNDSLADTLERSLREWIDARLSPAERPRALRFGPSLPQGESGKAADWRLDA